MKYYAAINSYGSPTSRGFANTWRVLVFGSRKDREQYVTDMNETNRSVHAIKKSDVMMYLRYWDDANNRRYGPAPFSSQYWGIDRNTTINMADDYPSIIGEVRICDGLESGHCHRHYG